MSNQKSLQNLKITSHWFDSSNSQIGVTLAYADKLDLNFGDRSTFSILADGQPFQYMNGHVCFDNS
jgi:hypothetical protein